MSATLARLVARFRTRLSARRAERISTAEAVEEAVAMHGDLSRALYRLRRDGPDPDRWIAPDRPLDGEALGRAMLSRADDARQQEIGLLANMMLIEQRHMEMFARVEELDAEIIDLERSIEKLSLHETRMKRATRKRLDRKEDATMADLASLKR